MNECVICLDPCTETMPCCNVHMHVVCMCSILENGFNKCPHCQKEMYPKPPPLQYVTIPMPINQYVEVDHPKLTCKNVIQTVGSFVLILMAVSLLYHPG